MGAKEVATEATDGNGLGEEPGPIEEPAQKLRFAVTGMGDYWRVDLFGDGFYKTWDCKTPGELGKAMADGYTMMRKMAP